MEVRQPAAPEFYTGDCARMAEGFLRGFSPPELPPSIVAAVVPHAGWVYSGAVSAHVFASIRACESPACFVLFGTPHRWHGPIGVWARGEWSTPLGPLPVDEDLARAVLELDPGMTTDDPAAHAGEHSIEVQLPFIRHLFPRARFVPVAVPPSADAADFGRRVGERLRQHPGSPVVIGSTDLTHYGDPYRFAPAGSSPVAQEWMRGNDRRLIDLAAQLRSDEILPEALSHHNACGPGALAATVAAAEAMGSGGGRVIDYTTSYDAVPEGEFRMAVGYVGMVF